LKSLFQRLYPYGVFRADEVRLTANGQQPIAYLTFDDGPIPEVTPKVLAILEQYGVKATFFMVGENIDKHPEVYEQVVKAGHAIGNHTYNHLKGWRTDFHEYMENTDRCADRTQNTDLFRPPYGKATFRQRRALHNKGYRLIYWDILTRDYEATRTPEQMLKQIQRDVRPGSIINFHDSLKSNERMLEVLPKVIAYLQAENYEIQTL
jgi:peptidoglycan/xylan/chitin deacetylase (PgdA/CDA1 family)